METYMCGYELCYYRRPLRTLSTPFLCLRNLLLGWKKWRREQVIKAVYTTTLHIKRGNIKRDCNRNYLCPTPAVVLSSLNLHYLLLKSAARRLPIKINSVLNKHNMSIILFSYIIYSCNYFLAILLNLLIVKITIYFIRTFIFSILLFTKMKHNLFLIRTFLRI